MFSWSIFPRGLWWERAIRSASPAIALPDASALRHAAARRLARVAETVCHTRGRPPRPSSGQGSGFRRLFHRNPWHPPCSDTIAMSVPAEPVLIVDDDQASCRFMAEVLAGAGYRVEWTTDDDGAIERVHRSAYSLVIADVTMPAVSGTEIVADLGRVRPGRRRSGAGRGTPAGCAAPRQAVCGRPAARHRAGADNAQRGSSGDESRARFGFGWLDGAAGPWGAGFHHPKGRGAWLGPNPPGPPAPRSSLLRGYRVQAPAPP